MGYQSPQFESISGDPLHTLGSGFLLGGWAEGRQRASRLAKPPSEQGLARAWEVLLNIDSGTLPDQSVIPHRLHLKVSPLLHHEDAETWDERNHPALVLKAFDIERVTGGDPRDLRFTIKSTHTVTGVAGAQVTSMEIRGPTGGTLTVEGGKAAPIVE